MTHSADRLPPGPPHQVDRARPLSFHYDGRLVKACVGDTIASASFASGRRIFSRSFKYHRPRGLLCCSGDCPNCMVEVDGKPNVRACSTDVAEGMQVWSQHAWPSVDHDLLRVIELFDRFLPIGFYYKTLYKPRLLWKIAEPIIRRLAGLGRVRAEQARAEFQHLFEYVDVLVVGGGPAGLEAASCAARAGHSVMLVEGENRLGGHLNYETRNYRYGNVLRGYELARRLDGVLRAQANVRILTKATAFGCYEGNLVPVLQGNRVVHVRTKTLIVATGCHQYPAVFSNNDLPGVMLSRSALRLMNVYGVRPGTRALIFTANDEGYLAAVECLHAGVEVAGIVDARYMPSALEEAAALRAKGVAIWNGMSVRKANGRRLVSSATIGPLDPTQGPERTVKCDVILLSTAWQGNSSLLSQAGCQLSFDSSIGHAVPVSVPDAVFAAGEVLGIRSFPELLESGAIAGKAAVQHLQGQQSSWVRQLHDQFARMRQTAGACALPPGDGGKKSFVCLCEDVLDRDLRQGVDEGFDEIETLKRYSTVSMGPCQGRMCGRSASEICGLATSRDYRTVGTSTVRPPIRPVPLGALAGPDFHPVKRSSMHYRHATMTATFMDMGVWKRPSLYSSIEEEYEAVRNRAGLIDVSSLGKLVIKGRDASALLDKVYTHRFSNLKPGQTRYGVICDEGGIILDDGTVARLGADHYYVTTSTGNVDVIEQWLKWWIAGTGWCAHVVNMTAGIAALNLAGPEARAILATQTDLDLSPSSFPYMACREGQVAGVPATLLRLGFVGETGWEVHFPAEYGEYMWETLLEAGASRGIRPFGVETQRLLRLEKKHIIVGQDTDALANPYDSDLRWVVRLDKPDFIGRHALETASHLPSANRLVGFEATQGGRPLDGSAIVIGGKLSGRITSVRFSPQMKKFVGMAWVPVEYAKHGSEIAFHDGGKYYPAVVVDGAFYDPAGARLK